MVVNLVHTCNLVNVNKSWVLTINIPIATFLTTANLSTAVGHPLPKSSVTDEIRATQQEAFQFHGSHCTECLSGACCKGRLPPQILGYWPSGLYDVRASPETLRSSVPERSVSVRR